jgi:hypothetical protein
MTGGSARDQPTCLCAGWLELRGDAEDIFEPECPNESWVPDTVGPMDRQTEIETVRCERAWADGLLLVLETGLTFLLRK